MRAETTSAIALCVGAFAVLAGLAPAAASAEPTVEIKNAVARLVVIPEPRSDVKVEFVSTNPALPITVTREGDRTVLNGGLGRRMNGCWRTGRQAGVTVRNLGRVSYDDLPQIVVRTPTHIQVAAGGAVFGSVGRSDSLVLSNAGCGDWTVANVKGELQVNQAGSGDTRAGAAGALVVHVAGSGDVSAGAVSGPMRVDIAGSGDVRAASIQGPLRANIAGSGDVHVAQGSASEVTVRIAGSGDLRFGGAAGELNAQVAGSGDVTVRSVSGVVKKTVLGSGGVRVGR